MKSIYVTLAFSFIISITRAQNINLYPDSVHLPFIYGVTSGDPTDSSIILWTALADDTTNTSKTVTWQLATDSTFTSIISSNSAITDKSHAYTVHVDVTGLQPFTEYCYRFGFNGQYSVTGFTKTAPRQSTDSLKFALVSCSSLFSGYFNAYRQIANNPTIDAIIHVGDFIYNKADPQERIRIPQPEPAAPVSLEDWYNMYRLYLLDPDLREARRKHPWIQIWDNHEINKGTALGITTKAFFDFTPVRKPSQDSTRIWRNLAYGSLLDIFMVDDYQYANADTFANGENKMLSDEELRWLKNGLDSSAAVWKILGVSKLFSAWDLGQFTTLLPGGGFNNSWHGYTQSRDSILLHIKEKNVNNPVVLSGDLHMNVVSDLALNPYDSISYEKETGVGGLGIEINGTGVSRGNLDESGISYNLAQTVYSFSLGLNPHQQYLNMYDHGFNTITINADSLIARFYLCPKSVITDSIQLDAVRFCKAGENHWARGLPSSIFDPTESIPVLIFPNPSATGLFNIKLPEGESLITVDVWNYLGAKYFSRKFTTGGLHQLNHKPLATGMYIISVSSSEGKQANFKIVSQ